MADPISHRARCHDNVRSELRPDFMRTARSLLQQSRIDKRPPLR